MRESSRQVLRRLSRIGSPGGARGRLTILIYHRVHAQNDPLFPEEVNAAEFDCQMATLSDCFHVLPLDEAVSRLRENSLPPAAAAITFDDGYADNYEVALPILQRHKLSATFFISSGFLDGGRMWNDTVIEALRRARGDELDLCSLGVGVCDLSTPRARGRSAESLLHRLKHLDFGARSQMVERIAERVAAPLPDDLMMTSAQVRELHAAGMGIGGHTVQHPILARLKLPHARTEIAEGRARLQEIIRAPVSLFAYPNGKPHQDYNAQHVQIAKQLGFSAAFSTAWGVAHSASDFFQLPRFTPWDKTPNRFTLRLLQNARRTRSETV
jgi:peptidoglycan/xylan/chitin deacetylase (PgdA/CDA1 family)